MTPTAIPNRVRKLIPVLGSPRDGEALGACRAIGRVLGGVGLDFHALAEALPETRETGGRPASCERRRPTAPDPAFGFNLYRQRRTFTPRQEAAHREQVAFCLSRREWLSPRERQFIDGISRLHGNLSIRQGDWLAALADRLDWEARRA